MMGIILLVLIIAALVAAVYGKDAAQGLLSCGFTLLGLCLWGVMMIVCWMDGSLLARLGMVVLVLPILRFFWWIISDKISMAANVKWHADFDKKAAEAEHRRKYLISLEWTKCQDALQRSDTETCVAALKQIFEIDDPNHYNRDDLTRGRGAVGHVRGNWEKSEWLAALEKLIDEMNKLIQPYEQPSIVNKQRAIDILTVLGKSCDFRPSGYWYWYGEDDPYSKPLCKLHEKFSALMLVIIPSARFDKKFRVMALQIIGDTFCQCDARLFAQTFTDVSVEIRHTALILAARMAVEPAIRPHVCYALIESGLEAICVNMEEGDADTRILAIRLAAVLGEKRLVDCIRTLKSDEAQPVAVRQEARSALIQLGGAAR